MHRFTGCFWRYSYQKHVVQAGRGCGSLCPSGPKHLTTPYDCWIGLGGPAASPPTSLDLPSMDFFLWFHFKALIYTLPFDLIAVSLRQQQPGILEHTCCVGVGCVSRSVPVCLNIWYKLVTNYNLSSEYFSRSAWFPNSVRLTLMVHGTARMQVQHTVAWEYIFLFVPSLISQSLGMEFFLHLVHSVLQISYFTYTRLYIWASFLFNIYRFSSKRNSWIFFIYFNTLIP